MRSIKTLYGLSTTYQAFKWSASLFSALPAQCSRQLAHDSTNGELQPVPDAGGEPYIFDAAEQGAPVAVHQLIGDPRTGIADDTTSTPWGEDVSVEWVWSSPSNGVDWYRYSMAGPDQLPYMYMDSRLSDHSKNLMYMLRCKDPQRWTIPALADKFRVRRQRVMAILALKEMQAHRIQQGLDMKGPLQPYTFSIPLQDFHVQPDGQPVDLAQLVADQQELQLAAAAAAAATGSPGSGSTLGLGPEASAAAEGLGSLEEFLAPSSSEAAATQQPDALSSLAAAASGQAADLATLMPQLALTAQQLQLQLLQLLQQHHYSTYELQRRLLHQVDVAEAYYNAHIAGTQLEKLLLASAAAPRKATTAAAGESSEGSNEGAASAAAKPAWLDFGAQRQQIQQLVAALQPVLQCAGPEQEREAGRLVAALKHALQEAAAPDAVPNSAAGGSSAEQQQITAAEGLAAVVKSADPSAFAAAFNQLELRRRQQLLELLPDTRILLNIQGTDLRAAVSSSSASSSSSSSEPQASAVVAAAPGSWPGEVPTVVDVWGCEEVPRKQLAELQKQLSPVQQLLTLLDGACAGLGSVSSSAVGMADVAAVQKAVQVYSGLVWEYDKVLAEQAAAAAGRGEPVLLPPAAQRRLLRILRELDMHALEKLLLWESYFKEAAADDAGRQGGRLQRLKKRVHAAIKQLNEAAAVQGQPGAFAEYPDLPADAQPGQRVDKDMVTAHLDAMVVGRQFHRGSGDRHYMRLESYPKFEGYSLEEFDSIEEGELSTLSRLAAERQDNMMWKEFRERLLRNFGLTAPNLYQHTSKARPPKPRKGWSYVVHPMGGAARSQIRQQLREQARQQWLDDDAATSRGMIRPGDLGAAQQGFDPARSPAPAEPYVAEPGARIRGLNEEEEVVAGASRPKPRRRWYASARSRMS